MYSYSNPLRMVYTFEASDFTTPITRHIKPPAGCTRGYIEAIDTSVITAFTQVTTPGHIRVGDGTTDGKYADLNMGAAAANTAYSDQDVAGSIVAGGIDLDRDNVSEIVLKTVAPTGGAPAGKADIRLVIAWS